MDANEEYDINILSNKLELNRNQSNISNHANENAEMNGSKIGLGNVSKVALTSSLYLSMIDNQIVDDNIN